MGTVRAIRQDNAATLEQACAAFLATLDYPETQGTRRGVRLDAPRAAR
jgi:hypothetical protein